MMVKQKLICLGMVRRLQFQDRKGSTLVETWRRSMGHPKSSDKKRAGLFSTLDKRELYIVPWVNPTFGEVDPGVFERAKVIAERWFNYKTEQKITIDFPSNVRNLKPCGWLSEIEYSSDKFENEKDRGEWNLYYHQSKKAPELFVNCPMTPYIWGVKDFDDRILWNYRGLIF